MTASQTDPFADELRQRTAEGLRRTLREIESAQGPRVTVAGRQLVCFASNNYLGLAGHPRVVTAVREAAARWGWGAGASPLVVGHMSPHARLQQRLAAFEGTGAAIVCSTGYQANLAAVRSLAGRGDVVLLDKLDHASIIDAARGSGATVRVYPHGDTRKLERLLARTASARRRVIVTDALFSMDGDFADLARLVELKERYDAILCVDEAHATGVWGRLGRGAAEMMGVADRIDVTVGTLSKALGGVGGFIAASRSIIDWIVQSAGAFIYSTALPSPACAAAEAALDLVAAEPDRRERLQTRAAELRDALRDQGWEIGRSESQIVPILVGEADRAVQLSAALEAEGLLVPAIRPPTVPRGRARLRVSLCSEHETIDLQRLVAALKRWKSTGSSAWGSAPGADQPSEPRP